MPAQCLLDLDGVIADFVTGICGAHNKPNPYLEKEHFGIFDTAGLWTMPWEEFIEPCNKEFWANLPKMPDADEIIAAVTDFFGIENVCILSAPTLNGGCVDGKIEWLSKHYPQFVESGRYLFGPRKDFCAGPYRVLIDDRDENITKFRENGGNAILLSRPWNSFYFRSEKAVKYLIHDLKGRTFAANIYETLGK